MTYWEVKRGGRSETGTLKGAVGRVLISLSFKTAKRSEEGLMNGVKPSFSLNKVSPSEDGLESGKAVLGLGMDGYLAPRQVRS